VRQTLRRLCGTTTLLVAATAFATGSAAAAGIDFLNFDKACDAGTDKLVTLCLGEAFRPRKGHAQTLIFFAANRDDRVKLTFFGDSRATAASFSGDYSFDLPDDRGVPAGAQQDALITVALHQTHHRALGTTVVRTRLTTGGPCVSEVTAGQETRQLACTTSKPVITSEHGTKHAQWSGTFSEDLAGVLKLLPPLKTDQPEPPGEEHTYYTIDRVTIRTTAGRLRRCPPVSAPAACSDKDVKKLAQLPLAVDVVYQRSGDGYTPKLNFDTKNVNVADGPAKALDELRRSRNGLDFTSAWSPWTRATFAFGQASSDQKTAADDAGDNVFRSALQNKDLKAGANTVGGALLDAPKASGAKDGFLATDAAVFAFANVSDSASALSIGGDSVKKGLGDVTAGVTPLDLTRLVAPDGAFKLVRRDDAPGQRGWHTRGGAIFDVAVGDDPGSVADGGATFTAARDDLTSRTSLTILYSVANRVQKLVDYRDPHTITLVPLTPTVSVGIPYPAPRAVHVVDEGIQLNAEHDLGLSTYLRATAEPGRAGSDFFAAERWQFGSSRPLPAGPGFRSTTVSLYGGWRGTGPDYFAPVGTRNDFAQTYGPFFIGHIESSTVAKGQLRQRHLTYTASRWDSALGLQQFVSRLDGSYDFQNRLAFTGTTTRSGATLFLITREQVAGTPIPLGRERLFPLDQGNVGVSWKPPAGELAVTDGFSYTTTCKNTATTFKLPPGVTLPPGSVLPLCVPNGKNVVGGTIRVASGPLTFGAHYGSPTFATSRTPDLNASIERVGALRYKFLKCNVLQVEYANRSGYNGLTDAAGSLFGASLEIHTFRLGSFKPVVTLSYVEAKSFPVDGPPNTKTASQAVPDPFHHMDDKGC
jgi:hypothetical protein